MNKRPTPVVLELAAALLVPAAILSFTKVFDSAEALYPLWGAALASTASSIALRRLGAPLVLSAVASAVSLGLLLTWQFAPDTTKYWVVPTSQTVDQLQSHIDALITNFRLLKAPVPSLEPFVGAAMVASWLMAFLTDWGALRLRLAFEPVLPAALLFIFSASLGVDEHQVVTSVVLASAIGFWAVTQRISNLADTTDWPRRDRERGLASLRWSAGVLALVSVGLGTLAWPLIPGSQSEELVSLSGEKESTRKVVSPYVRIEQRLVEQSSIRLFTVTTERPSYWRLASLDTYENNIWTVAANFSSHDGDLPGNEYALGQRDTVRQDFTIQNLDAIWLPAAYAPDEILDSSAEITWNGDIDTLTVSTDIADGDGVSYSLNSLVPTFTSDELAAAASTVPTDLAEDYLALPADVSPVVRDEALTVTQGATNRYDQMLALQDYFRSFEYSTTLSPRSADPVAQFLSEQIGFCQQFAGTFALMARSLGAPSRVAIGFTWGDEISTDPDGRTTYQVSGRHTHAWPEVWFAEYGWVAFEPTPGRGAPGATEYSQVAAAQDSPVRSVAPTDQITTTTTAPLEDLPTTTLNPFGEFDEPVGGGVAGGQEGITSSKPFLVLFGVTAALGLYIGGIVGLRAWRRYLRRRRSSGSQAGLVAATWADTTETLELGYGLVRNPAETRTEFAVRVDRDRRVSDENFGELAKIATVARFHPDGIDNQQATLAISLGKAVENSVQQRVRPIVWWRRVLNPRNLIGRTSRRRQPKQTISTMSVVRDYRLPKGRDGSSQAKQEQSELV